MKKTKNSIYIVETGDTLNSIAAEYNINPTKILLANNCTPKMITQGMVLFIPTSHLS
ncbi:MAG: LysM peptidoglycan-binding domain-containing protein [Acetobacter sp.]|nr:LysM peptidoglycan-binding domain-containing protein [Acetobacter sp.]